MVEELVEMLVNWSSSNIILEFAKLHPSIIAVAMVVTTT